MKIVFPFLGIALFSIVPLISCGGSTSPSSSQTTAQWACVSAGEVHTLAIKTDGTLWAWGNNYYGQLGDGTAVDKNTPTQIGTDTNWAVISAGGIYSLAVKTDGTLWAWGNNWNGRLGDGTEVQKNAPVRIGTDTDWSSVTAAIGLGGHSFALKRDGSLWGWGWNVAGQVGDGTTVDKLSPVQISANGQWAVISAGWSHTVALKTNGTLWAWGSNHGGQLGDGTTDFKAIPTQIGTDTNWGHASAGGHYTLGVKNDGTLWGWGFDQGPLGSGGINNITSPLQIGSDTNWAFVSAGAASRQVNPIIAAIKTNGTLWAWGDNRYGQIGDGTFIDKDVPVQIGSDTNWRTVSAGGDHMAALKPNSTLWLWGSNVYGELGNGASGEDQSKNTPINLPCN